MTITGTIERVVRRRTPHGSTWVTMTIGGHPWRFLADGSPLPVRGTTVTLDGVAMGGTRLGAVRWTA